MFTFFPKTFFEYRDMAKFVEPLKTCWFYRHWSWLFFPPLLETKQLVPDKMTDPQRKGSFSINFQVLWMYAYIYIYVILYIYMICILYTIWKYMFFSFWTISVGSVGKKTCPLTFVLHLGGCSEITWRISLHFIPLQVSFERIVLLSCWGIPGGWKYMKFHPGPCCSRM